MMMIFVESFVKIQKVMCAFKGFLVTFKVHSIPYTLHYKVMFKIIITFFSRLFQDKCKEFYYTKWTLYAANNRTCLLTENIRTQLALWREMIERGSSALWPDRLTVCGASERSDLWHAGIGNTQIGLWRQDATPVAVATAKHALSHPNVWVTNKVLAEGHFWDVAWRRISSMFRRKVQRSISKPKSAREASSKPQFFAYFLLVVRLVSDVSEEIMSPFSEYKSQQRK
jgi:hypothetical protein